MKKSGNLEILIVSFALFSMFFGAGNVIFPPSLGLISGKDFWLSSFGFIVTGSGLSILGIVSIAKAGNLENFANKVFKQFPTVIGVLIMISIGPLLAIPKTAALTHEIGIVTLFGGANKYVSIAIFFIITLFFSLNSTNVIDKLGAILTPALLIALVVLIVKGIISPIGVPQDLGGKVGFSRGFVEGYQTMDALASIMFAFVIINTIKQKGYEGKELQKMTSITGILAGLGLALIYLGFVYIGACAGSIAPADISRSELVIFVAEKILGTGGKLILSTIIGLACLTTSIGLTTTAGQYFEDISKGKLPYKVVVSATCIVSCLIAYNGVQKIVAFSAPVLSALYPTVILLMVFSMFSVKSHGIYKGACLPVLAYGIISVFLGEEAVAQIETIYPLFSHAFGWVPIAIIGGVVGRFLLRDAQ